MTNLGPPGEDERPLAGLEAGTGPPESDLQHAISTDFAAPLDRTTDLDASRSDGTGPGDPAPPAPPAPPAYDDPADLLRAVPDVDAAGGLFTSHAAVSSTPAYDALAEESGLTDPVAPTSTVPLTDDHGYYSAGGSDGGALAKVKAFADQRPAAFLGAALVAGWLVGKLFSSSDDGED